MADDCIIHFLVPDPNGPIRSGPGGRPIVIPGGGRWRFACDDTQKMTPTDYHRASGEPWAANCPACKRTAVFKERDRPKPGQEKATETAPARG